jgi:hypothetical protein
MAESTERNEALVPKAFDTLFNKCDYSGRGAPSGKDGDV